MREHRGLGRRPLRGVLGRLAAGLTATALVTGLFAGAVGGVASAATLPACTTAHTTSTCTATVTVEPPAGLAVHGNALNPLAAFHTKTKTPGFTPLSPTSFKPTTPMGTATATVNKTGGISNLTLPSLYYHEYPSKINTGSTETIIIRQKAPGTTTGTINATGDVVLHASLQFYIPIRTPVPLTCVVSPTVDLQSTSPYTATSRTVTLTDTSFTIPNFTAKTTGSTCGLAAGELNTRFAGSSGNQLTFGLSGTLPVPPPPAAKSTTTLTSVSPAGQAVAKQAVTLTATVTSVTSGVLGATGATVTFMAGGTALGAPQPVVTGRASLTTSSLPTEPGQQLTAAYSGNGAFAPSTSAPVNYSVVPAPTITANLPASMTNHNQNTTFTFTLTITNPSNGESFTHLYAQVGIKGIFDWGVAQFSYQYQDSSGTWCTLPGKQSTSKTTWKYGIFVGRGASCTPTYPASFSLAAGSTLTIPMRIIATETPAAAYGRATVIASLSTGTATKSGTKVTTDASGPLTGTASPKSEGTVTLLPPNKLTVRLTASSATRTVSKTFGANFTTKLTPYTKDVDATGPTGTVTVTVGGTAAHAMVIQLNSSPRFTTNTTGTLIYNTSTLSVGHHVVAISYPGNSMYNPSSISVGFTVLPTPSGTLYSCIVGGLDAITPLSAYVSVASTPLPADTVATTTSTVIAKNTKVTVDFDPVGGGSFDTAQKADILGFSTGNVDAKAATFASSAVSTGIALDPVTDLLYVTDSSLNLVTVLTGKTNKFIKTIPVGSHPSGIAVDPTTDKIYVADSGDDLVSIITGVSDTATTIVRVGSKPAGVTVDPSMDKIYVANEGSGTVSIINGDYVTKTITLGAVSANIVADPTTHKVYMSNSGLGTLSVITGTNRALTARTPSIAVGTDPLGVAVNPVTDKVYVANNGSNTLSVVTGSAGALTATRPTIAIATSPSYVAVDPTTDTIDVSYIGATVTTPSTHYPELAVVTGTTGTVSTPTSYVQPSKALVINPASGNIYVPSASYVWVYKATTATYVAAVQMPSVPPGIIGTFSQTATGGPIDIPVHVAKGTAPGTKLGASLGSFSFTTGSFLVDAYLCNPVTTPATFGTVTVAGTSLSSTPAGSIVLGTSVTLTASVAPKPTSNAGTVSFSETVGGTSTYLGTVPVSTGGTNQPPAGTASLKVTPTTTGEHTYSATWSGTLSVPKNTSVNTVTVTVATAPAVTTQPAGQTVNEGTTATFTAAASGTPAPTVQWQVSTDGGSTWSTVTGATTASYTTPATTGADNGDQYRAVFTNGGGTATTDAATLTVVVPPTVTAQPAGATVDAGSPALFAAKATGSSPSVQWQVSTDGGKTWADAPGTPTDSSGGPTTLTTTYTTAPTTGSDNGDQYRVMLSNAAGTATSDAALLTVNTGPAVTTQPADASVDAGQTATFHAAAAGTPAPGVQWQVSTDGGTTWSNVAGATADVLTVTAVGTDNGNEYRAVFTNPVGTSASDPATLSVAVYGYRLVGSNGAVFSYGDASFYGSMGGKPLNQPIVGTASTPGDGGYWLVAADGGIFSFGDAQFYGSMGGKPLNQPIVGMAATPTGKGYWEVASDGGIFAFGSAQFYGSMGGKPLNQPIVGMAATPTGGGYWEVAADGGIFAFGSAQFYGSTGSLHLVQPIVGMAPTAGGGGYWLVAKDGGIFSFGSAQFYGTVAGTAPAPIAGMLAAPTGAGYWEAAANGQVFQFGKATSSGTAMGETATIVAMSS